MTVFINGSTQQNIPSWEQLIGHSILIEYKLSFAENFSNGKCYAFYSSYLALLLLLLLCMVSRCSTCFCSCPFAMQPYVYSEASYRVRLSVWFTSSFVACATHNVYLCMHSAQSANAHGRHNYYCYCCHFGVHSMKLHFKTHQTKIFVSIKCVSNVSRTILSVIYSMLYFEYSWIQANTHIYKYIYISSELFT